MTFIDELLATGASENTAKETVERFIPDAQGQSVLDIGILAETPKALPVLARRLADVNIKELCLVLHNYRLREAEWLLVNRKDIPVGQVGELCGFSSPSVFHRAFVQSHDGLTPNRYRKQTEEK